MVRSSLWSRPALCLLTIVFLVLSAATGLAQEATGKIVGTVTDPQGAVMPGVKVTVTNAATGVSEVVTSDKDGYFQALNLPVGDYQVVAEKASFRKLVAAKQTLQINQSLRLDLRMQLGAQNEEVTVEGTAAAVETVNPTLGQSITSRPILDLPLNGRNVLSLALLQPGVTEANPGAQSGGQAGSFGVAGGKSDSVTYLLDGGNNNDLLGNEVVFTPPPDAISEFRILTSNYTAEYGRNANGVVSMVSKSGTNSIHGSIYDFLRNDALNANSYFNKQEDLPREVLKRNQFGATLGGPITIPKVVDGHDKYFWFFSYTGQRQTQVETTSTIPVYTPLELQGNFSQSYQGGPDPYVARFLQQNPYYQADPAMAAQAIIDPTKFSPVAQNYIKAGLIPSSASGNINAQGLSTNNIDQVETKLDFNFSQKDKVSAKLGWGRNPVLNPFSFSFGSSSQQDALGYGSIGDHHRWFSNFEWDHTFTNSVLNEARFTAQRINIAQAIPAKTLPTGAALGITGVTPDQATGPAIIGFYSGLTMGFSPQGPTTEINNTFAWYDTLTWVKGAHTMKYGFYFSPYQNNTLYDFYVNGEFDFYGNTSLYQDPANPNGLQLCGGAGSCNDHADFLLGLPDEYYQFGAAPSNIRSKSWAGFAQDEWHVRKNLVVTYGLRYEYNSPKLDTKGRSFSLIPGLQSTRFVNAPQGLVFPGDKGAPEGANFPDRNNFAPRFGFAWDPRGDGKTSVRGGFGVFYDILKGEDNLQYNGQAPFFGFTDFNLPPLAANPTSDPGYLVNPFTAAGVTNPFPSKPPAQNIDFNAAGFLPFGGGGVYFVNPHLRTPYTYQYNLSVQRDVAAGLTAEVSYVGNITKKQTTLVDQNPFPIGGATRILNAGLPSDNFSYLLTFDNLVNANYNSLQTSLTKQITQNSWIGNTYFKLAYTWGKATDNSSGFRNTNSRVPYYDHELFRAVSDYDVAHRIAFSGGWDMPFDKMWASGPKRLVKGWSLYPIVTWRTGFPLDISAQLPNRRTVPGPSGAGDSALVRADVASQNIATYDPHQIQSINVMGTPTSGNFYFDASQFSAVDQTTNLADPYGSYPRNHLRGPGRSNFDLELAKITPLAGERMKLEFRAEFFNILNKAEFQDPQTNIDSSQFGQVSSTYDPRIIQFGLRLSF